MSHNSAHPNNIPHSGTNGPHHCISAANTVTDLIFRYLRTRCTAQGGKLSIEDLEDANRRFAESVTSGFDLFETIHTRCMRASGAAAPMLFTRNTILATLLSECGYQSAETAFAHQLAVYGQPWLRHFFQGLADCARETVCKDADYRLIGTYVKAAKEFKGKVSAAELLKGADVQAVLHECVAPLFANNDPRAIEQMRLAINGHIMLARKGVEDDPSKVGQPELQRFIVLLRNEFDLAMKNANTPVAAPTAVAASAAAHAAPAPEISAAPAPAAAPAA